MTTPNPTTTENENFHLRERIVQLENELAVYRKFAIDQYVYLRAVEEEEIKRPPIRYCTHNNYDPQSRCQKDRSLKCGLYATTNEQRMADSIDGKMGWQGGVS